jgi:hypothetical protein
VVLLLFYIPYLFNMMRQLYNGRSVLEQMAQSNHAEPNAISEVLGNIRTIFGNNCFSGRLNAT